MNLKNHIAFRFLNDEKLWWEIMEIYFPILKTPEFVNTTTPEMSSTYSILTSDSNKNYYVTESVISKLELLKVYPQENKYDWTVFKNIKEGKSTFILPDNSLVRVVVREHQISFTCVSFELRNKKTGEGYMSTCMFFSEQRNK